MVGGNPAAHHGGHGDDGVHLQRERAELQALRGASVTTEPVLQRFVLLLAAALVVAGFGADAAQRAAADVQARLKTLFPGAAGFSPKQGQPPHYVAYGPGAEESRPVLGYAWWTTDLVPLERGYSGPIAMLVGITPRGVLTGLVMGEHQEPYGYFSIDRPAFAAHFRNKDVRDPFLLGGDIDAISTATITMSSAVRAVRNSSRQIARRLLPPPGTPK